jgi:outer membrane receptor protein involved in Fe transport
LRVVLTPSPPPFEAGPMRFRTHSRARASAFAILAAALTLVLAPTVQAATMGKVQGKLLATDTGVAIGFADVLLIPADTTMHKVGGLTNADGSYLLEAPAGRWTIQFRALSYAVKKVEGLVLTAGQVTSFDTALQPQAIQQEEIVVEARAKQNTESSVLSARRKASTVGDAVSAEQVRRSPDKNTAEVLRRVTGLTVSDGRYVFVRGLGERYSSTEIDGVRVASPEQNKRVVPLDLVPSNLLDNVVVQKSYSADRQGEFGGGDVQLHTKDFPGARTWSLSLSEGYGEDVTFHDRATYHGTSGDGWGFGAGSRGLPQAIEDATGTYPLVAGQPPYGTPRKTLASLARSFADVWSPGATRATPNTSYALSYGDEFKLFGRQLGLIASSSFARSFTHRNESERFFASPPDTFYDYAVDRSTASAQLGGIAGLSYRVSPAHSMHLRAFATNSADDEVRTYQGSDHNRVDSYYGNWIQHRDTRLKYVQRSLVSASLEGRDEFPHLLGVSFDWALTRSGARRQVPDMREVSYDEGYYQSGSDVVSYWTLGSPGTREFGDMNEHGRGARVTGTLPYPLGALGAGRLVLGYDHQKKTRGNFYRRFDMYANNNADPTAPPESLFSAGSFNGGAGTGYVEEATLAQDNYHARAETEAEFVSLDVPLGRQLRSTLGVRREFGIQDVKSFDLFRPDVVTAEGRFSNVDWLPSANLTWAAAPSINVRLAASRSLSRPDLNELSPSPTLEYVGGYRQAGNPNLHRATLENYDARIETFPSMSEVFAAGVFYKKLREPIEQTLAGAVPPLLMPVNSDHGHNQGVELEARSSLGRIWGRMKGLSLNANATFISSRVSLKHQTTVLSSQEHPLQGQAKYVVNAGLFYESRGHAINGSLLLGRVGERLRTIGYLLPDVYDQPTTSLDASFSLSPFHRGRLSMTAKNLANPNVRQLQGGKEVSAYRDGRSYSLAFNLGD